MGIFILKLMMLPLAALDGLLNVIYAFIMWDKRAMDRDWLFDYILGKK